MARKTKPTAVDTRAGLISNAVKADNRALLSVSPNGQLKSGQFARWMSMNPEAVRFVDDFLDLRRGGECYWSLPDVIAHLKKVYSAPAVRADALRKWILTNRAEKWGE